MDHKLTYHEMVEELQLYTLTDIIAMYYESRTGNSQMENYINEDLYNRITSITNELNNSISTEPKQDITLNELINLRVEILQTTDDYINHLRKNKSSKSINTKEPLDEVKKFIKNLHNTMDNYLNDYIG